MKQFLMYVFILIIILVLVSFMNMKDMFLFEGFNNNHLEQMKGEYPSAQEKILVQDTYPQIGKEVSQETANKMWWKYPIFEVGSYEQITNNLKYPDNPDDARCTPGDFCYALYGNRNLGSNVVTPLPPVQECGTRVGYFATDVNLLPFKTVG